MRFHPVVEAWFSRRFPHGPTDAQARGWDAIASGQSTLIAAPTGSGKTLAAFLVCLDRLVRDANDASTPPAEAAAPSRTQVVYVSPLKALGVDIQQNLEAPLREISALCSELGYRAPDVRVAVRSGDTEPGARAAMLRRPPDILITTPESLYLLLTADKSRAMLSSTRTVIVDEIHALARDKRGAHLALTLERLEHVAKTPLVRIGLSATQRPIELVAKLLCGVLDGAARPCTIVDTGHRRAMDLAIELPGSELSAVASTEQMNEVMDRVAKHVAERRTTLVFVNTRRLAERCAHMLAERLGEDRVAAHHGSLSKDRRLRVEQRLRAGELRAIVATASLELGIDVGPVELVCQIGSPRSIATLLQRVGRSGHHRFGMPVGRLYPMTRDELVECAATVRAVLGGRLDALSLPSAPLDVLSQQIVAECAAETWNEEELFALYRRAAPYEALARDGYESALHLISEGVVTGRGVRAAYVQRDRVGGQLKGRRSARLSALTSGGAIPENADYRVIAEPDETLVGTINEDFAIESMAGDVFLLGSTSWRVRRVEKGTVRVEDAKGATPTLPFWLGEAPARTAELSDEVSTLRREVEAQLALGGADAARAWLEGECSLDAVAAGEIARYLDAVRCALGLLPTRSDLVIERFFDETGGMQLVVHSPNGGRINRALGLLLRKRFCTGFDFELQAAANDDAIVLSLGPQHSFPLDDMHGFLRPGGVREALTHAVIVTPMFGVRWRWNLNRSLVVLRMKGGKKNPPPIQRMEADDVMVAVFPALAQCQDNANGPREIPDHVLVQQTLNDCLHEAMDLDALNLLLDALKAGEVRMHFRDTTEPSPLSHEILNSKPYTFLDDAPLEERRTRAVQTRRGLPVAARELAALDLTAIDRVRSEAERAPRDADELHDVLRELCICIPRDDWSAWFAELVQQGRALEVAAGLNVFWCASERKHFVAALLERARFTPDRALPEKLEALLASEPVDRETAATETLRGHLDTLGPITVAQLGAQLGLPETTVLAALAQLELRGFALRGMFDPRLPGDAEQYCARRLLARIHAYTHERLRRDIEPVTPQDFMRFLVRYQHAAPGFQLTGNGGVQQVIEQLQGFELAAGAWESEVLAARVERYKPEQLDALCLSGEVCWGRPSKSAGALAQQQASATLSRATPITLALRGDYGWLALAHSPGGHAAPAADQPLRPSTERVLATLRERGALFMNELAAHADLPLDVLHEALWDGVARGLVTADGFGALRNLLGPNPPAALAMSSARRVGLRRPAPRTQSAEGRWALAPSAPVPSPDAPLPHIEELAETAAGQLLARYGVVFRDLITRDALGCAAGIPYREITWALRRFEARGLVRGGRFVNGFVGEQFALPEAVELLRSVRRAPHDGKVLRLNGCDPLNLTGIVLPGPRVPATRTNVFYLRDGLRVDATDAASMDATQALS